MPQELHPPLTTLPDVAPRGADPDLHDLLTVEDVARLLKVSKSWVYEHTRAGATPSHDRLPHIRVGKYLRFDAQAVRTFLGRHARAL